MATMLYKGAQSCRFYILIRLTRTPVCHKCILSYVRYLQLYTLKKANPTLKILVSLGGPDFSDDRGIADILANPSFFAHSTVAFLRRHHFDGIDLYLQNISVHKAGKRRKLIALLCKVWLFNVELHKLNMVFFNGCAMQLFSMKKCKRARASERVGGWMSACVRVCVCVCDLKP